MGYLMHFVVLGSGAVGGYFGARLAQSGQQVTFVARNQQFIQMRDHGLVLQSINGDASLPDIEVVERCDQLRNIDVILLAVKSFQLSDAVKSIKSAISPTTRIIPLLNGVNAAEQLINAGIDKTQVYGGVAKIISQVTSPGVISHTGANPHITFGQLNLAQVNLADNDSEYLASESSRLVAIAECFRQANVSVGVSKHIELALWRKFIFVAAWGTLASMQQQVIGELRNGDNREKLIAIINEYANIACALNVTISEQMISDTLAFIDALPAKSQTSMQRDIASQRQSEFDSLVAYPYQISQQYRLVTPVLDECYQYLVTRAVHEKIQQ